MPNPKKRPNYNSPFNFETTIAIFRKEITYISYKFCFYTTLLKNFFCQYQFNAQKFRIGELWGLLLMNNQNCPRIFVWNNGICTLQTNTFVRKLFYDTVANCLVLVCYVFYGVCHQLLTNVWFVNSKYINISTRNSVVNLHCFRVDT